MVGVHRLVCPDERAGHGYLGHCLDRVGERCASIGSLRHRLNEEAAGVDRSLPPDPYRHRRLDHIGDKGEEHEARRNHRRVAACAARQCLQRLHFPWRSQQARDPEPHQPDPRPKPDPADVPHPDAQAPGRRYSDPRPGHAQPDRRASADPRSGNASSPVDAEIRLVELRRDE